MKSSIWKDNDTNNSIHKIVCTMKPLSGGGKINTERAS